MTMRYRPFVLGLAATAVLFSVAGADARPRHRVHGYRPVAAYRPVGARPIVVTRRSFLDSGNVVPIGSTNAYVQEIVRFERPPLANTSPDILWRPDPGPGEPLF